MTEPINDLHFKNLEDPDTLLDECKTHHQRIILATLIGISDHPLKDEIIDEFFRTLPHETTDQPIALLHQIEYFKRVYT